MFSELNAAYCKGVVTKSVFAQDAGEGAFRRRRVPKGSASVAIAWSAGEATHDASGCPTCKLPLAAAARWGETHGLSSECLPSLKKTTQRHPLSMIMVALSHLGPYL